MVEEGEATETTVKLGRVSILGIPIDRVSLAQAAGIVLALTRQNRPRQVVTINPEFVIGARRDAEFRASLVAADLAVADGVGIVLAARLLGRPVPERVGGIDLVLHLTKDAASGTRLFLLGARQGVAQEAGQALLRLNPDLCLAGTYAGSPAEADEDAIVALIREARPHLLLVAFGAPAQERWISRNKERIGVPVAMGVGGAFDFLSGRVKRAPESMRRLGLEWLYRLAREPWRWHRMLALPQFSLLVLWYRLQGPWRHAARR